MDIYVLDSTAQILDMIDNFKSIIWTVQYFNVGEFELDRTGDGEKYCTIAKR